MTQPIPVSGLKVYISKADAAPLDLVPTDITHADPAVVTVADVTGVVEGSMVSFNNTDYTELDGNSFIVGAVDGSAMTFEVLGADTSGSSNALSGVPEAHVYEVGGVGGDLVEFCLSSLSREAGSADTVSVATYCDESATIAGTSNAGTMSFSGYMDPDEDGFLELLKAVDDKQARTILIELPQNKGYIICSGTINSYSEDYALGNAISFTSGMALATNPTYIWS